MRDPNLNKVRKGDKPSASEHNKLIDTVTANAGSLHSQGFADSTGFHTRRSPVHKGVGTQVRSAKIQTDGVPADNVGPFVCKLIDADGNVTGDPIDVWPCDHLGSAPFDSLDVWPHFLVNDYMSIFKDLDGKWYTTFVFDDKLFMARGCRIQTGGVPGNNAGPFVCKLLDADALEFGDNINVWPSQHLGTSVFDGGNVHPNFAAGDYMTISKDADGEWYTTFVFEDTVPCICFGS